MDIQQIGLIAAGGAVLFFPQLKKLWTRFAAEGGSLPPSVATGSVKLNTSRSAMLAEILELQEKAQAMEIPVAAEELQKAAHAIIGGGKRKP